MAGADMGQMARAATARLIAPNKRAQNRRGLSCRSFSFPEIAWRIFMAAPRPSKTQIGNHRLHPETLMLSYGYDPQLSEGAVKPPVFLTSTFVFRTAEDGQDF